MLIGMPVYTDVDLLDVTGPHEVLGWMKDIAGIDVTIQLFAKTPGEITTRDGFTFKVDNPFLPAPKLDVLWVPGGKPEALLEQLKPESGYIQFLKSQSNATWICSVCEGAVLLAESGLLDGYLITTHHDFIPCFSRYPKVKMAQGFPRFVHDRNRLTGGGISSGLDEAFKLVQLLSSYQVAQEIQSVTQYYPCPPVASELVPATSCPLWPVAPQ
jgi:transcriptional regulator GlxA family with amidase domain